jgi:capsular polysaccharide biosynthesis protein
MTVQSPGDTPKSPVHQPDWPDDEIDLRQYIQALIDWWREILLIAIVAALATAALLYLQQSRETPMYRASATVAIARVVSDINFDERFRTLSEDTASVQRASDDARRAALVGLVSSGAVAQAVIDELGAELDEEEQMPAVLLEKINANVVPGANPRVESDLIRITATAESPDKAAAIANAWAKHYVGEINSIYGQVPPETVETISGELVEAQAVYEETQKNLEAFVADNQVKRLQRQIDEKQAIVDTLQAGKQTAVATIVDEELKARRDVISAYIQALSENRLLGFTKEQQAKRDLLEAYRRRGAEPPAGHRAGPRGAHHLLQSAGGSAAHFCHRGAG